jgi:hypothetical protein
MGCVLGLLGVILALIGGMVAVAWTVGGWLGLAVVWPLPVIVLGFVCSEWRSWRPVPHNPWLSEHAVLVQARVFADEPFCIGSRIVAQVVRDDASRPGGSGARSVLDPGGQDPGPRTD